MNLSTCIILILLIGVVALAIHSLIQDKKHGRSSCGGDCGACGSQCMCHDPQELFQQIREQEFKH